MNREATLGPRLGGPGDLQLELLLCRRLAMAKGQKVTCTCSKCSLKTFEDPNTHEIAHGWPVAPATRSRHRRRDREANLKLLSGSDCGRSALEENTEEEEEASEEEVLNRRGRCSSSRPFLHLDALGFVLVVGLRLAINDLRQSRGLVGSANALRGMTVCGVSGSRSSSLLNFGSRTRLE